MIWLLGFGAAVLFLLGQQGTTGPAAAFALPDGVLPTPLGVDDVAAASGQRYRVTSYRTTLTVSGSAQPLLYYVAVRTGTKDWISYFFDPTTKVRTIGGVSFETPAGRAQLQQDYGL